MGCVNSKPDVAKGRENHLNASESRHTSNSIGFKLVASRTVDEINISNESIYRHYQFGKLLGSGNFGNVKLAQLKRDKSKMYAVKTIPKSKLKDKLHLLKRELQILRSLDHPNVARFYETY
jgi:calcium-dependent protein kinase